MPTYKAPLRDLKFAYFELFDGEGLTKLPGFEEATPDLLLSVAEEMGKISSEVLQPLNAVGDQQGCQLENGQVRTPKGFAEAWKLLRDGGWMGLTARPEYGGQGLPHTAGNMTAEQLSTAMKKLATNVGSSLEEVQKYEEVFGLNPGAEKSDAAPVATFRAAQRLKL